MPEQANMENSNTTGSPSYVDPRNGPDSLTCGPEFSRTFAEGLPGAILTGVRHGVSCVWRRLRHRNGGADG